MQVSKDMLIGQLLMVDEGVAPILMGAGMHVWAVLPHRENLWKRHALFMEFRLIR